MKAKLIGCWSFFFFLINKELEFVHEKVYKPSLLEFLISFNASKICRGLLSGL